MNYSLLGEECLKIINDRSNKFYNFDLNIDYANKDGLNNSLKSIGVYYENSYASMNKSNQTSQFYV